MTDSIATAIATVDGQDLALDDLIGAIVTEGAGAFISKTFHPKYHDCLPATIIFWLRDDAGTHHYVVSDGTDALQYASTVDDAWEVAVELTRNSVRTENPADIAYDARIPAKAHLDRNDLRLPVRGSQDPMRNPGNGHCTRCGLYPLRVDEAHVCDGEYQD